MVTTLVDPETKLRDKQGHPANNAGTAQTA